MARAAFWAFGYAGYVFPLLLIVYGAGAFVRAPLARGWPGLAGLALLLVSVTGILARRSDTLAEIRVHKGGMLGWAVGEALGTTVGSVGSWIILLAILPVAALFITQAVVRESRDESGDVAVDIPGTLLITAAIASLTYGLIEAGNRGWGDTLIVMCLAAAVVFGLLFVRYLLDAAPAGAATPRALRVHG